MPRRGTFKQIHNENQLEDSVADATVLEPLSATHSCATRAPRQMDDGQVRRVMAKRTDQSLRSLPLEPSASQQSSTSSARLPSLFLELRRYCAQQSGEWRTPLAVAPRVDLTVSSRHLADVAQTPSASDPLQREPEPDAAGISQALKTLQQSDFQPQLPRREQLPLSASNIAQMADGQNVVPEIEDRQRLDEAYAGTSAALSALSSSCQDDPHSSELPRRGQLFSSATFPVLAASGSHDAPTPVSPTAVQCRDTHACILAAAGHDTSGDLDPRFTTQNAATACNTHSNFTALTVQSPQAVPSPLVVPKGPDNARPSALYQQQEPERRTVDRAENDSRLEEADRYRAEDESLRLEEDNRRAQSEHRRAQEERCCLAEEESYRAVAKRVRKQLDELPRAHNERRRADKERRLAELKELIRKECRLAEEERRRADAEHRLAEVKRSNEKYRQRCETFVGLRETKVARRRLCEGRSRREHQKQFDLYLASLATQPQTPEPTVPSVNPPVVVDHSALVPPALESATPSSAPSPPDRAESAIATQRSLSQAPLTASCCQGVTISLDLHLHSSSAGQDELSLPSSRRGSLCGALQAACSISFASATRHAPPRARALRRRPTVATRQCVRQRRCISPTCASRHSQASRPARRADSASSTPFLLVAPAPPRRALVVRDDSAKVALWERLLLRPLFAALLPSAAPFPRPQRRRRRRWKPPGA